jgi:cytochrome c biogenesis protein CcmG/thiol:disulfide interchange protein DsbE
MMRKTVLYFAIAGVVVALLVIGARYTQRVGESLGPPAGAIQLVSNPLPLPDFSATTLDGKRITKKDLQGKVAIVNFWATWCGPCRKEIPDFIALQEKYQDTLVIVGFSVDETGEQGVREFAAQYAMNYPVAMVTADLRHVFGRVYALPTSLVVDRDGMVVQKHVGLMDSAIYEQEIRAVAGLPVNARIERVTDTGQVSLKNAAQATEVPGIDLSPLSPAEKRQALERLNSEKCTCGCDFTLAECRINDAACDISLPKAKKVVEEIRNKSN